MSGQEKFDTCTYRSAEKHFSFETRRCCGKEQAEGYLCFKKQLEDVTPDICEVCIYYQEKINV